MILGVVVIAVVVGVSVTVKVCSLRNALERCNPNPLPVHQFPNAVRMCPIINQFELVIVVNVLTLRNSVLVEYDVPSWCARDSKGTNKAFRGVRCNLTQACVLLFPREPQLSTLR